MNYIIFGASSGVGKELAYKFASERNNLILCSRDKRDLIILKSDLEIKFKIKVKVLKLDLSLDKNVTKILKDKTICNTIDGMLFPIGLIYEDDKVYLKEKKINDIVKANFLSIAKLVSNYIKMKKKCSIIGFGSISGYLGRDINTFYASSKRALESFFESIAFRKIDKKIKVQFYILGYLDTNLSFGRKLFLPKGSVKNLSTIVYNNKNVIFGKYYYPKWWFIIAIFLKIIPLRIIKSYFS
jgi:short-subunit dehydrogenase